MSSLTYLTTFSLGGYVSTIIARYHERFNNCCQTNGAMTLISLISGGELQNEVFAAATLMRWAVCRTPESSHVRPGCPSGSEGRGRPAPAPS